MSKAPAKNTKAPAAPKAPEPPTYTKRAVRLTSSVKIGTQLYRSKTILADLDPKIEAELISLKVGEYVSDADLPAEISAAGVEEGAAAPDDQTA